MLLISVYAFIAAYYITCLTAAVEFIDSMEIPSDIQQKLCTDFHLLSLEAGSSDDEDTAPGDGEGDDAAAMGVEDISLEDADEKENEVS